MDLNNVEFFWIKSIPKNWKIEKVKNHFSISKNTTETPDQFPVLSLTLNGIINRDVSTNKGQLPESYNGYILLEKNDIVFNPMDLISGWVDCSSFSGLISPSYKVIRPISNQVNIKFYTYYFQTHYSEKIFFPFGEGVHYEYRWGLGSETLKNFPIVLPPLDEQEKIVSFLQDKKSSINTVIEKTNKKIDVLKEGISSFVFYGKKLENKKDYWFQKIPVEWTILKFRDVFENIVDKNHPYERLCSVHQKKGVIYRDEQRQNVMNPTGGTSDYKLVKKGDFVISLRSSEGGFEFSEIKGLVSPVYTVLRPKFQIDTVLYKFLFKSQNFIEEINRYITGIREGKTINYNDIKDIPVPVPNFIDQEIISKHKQILKLFKTLRKREVKLNKYFKSLVSELVLGKNKIVQ